MAKTQKPKATKSKTTKKKVVQKKTKTNSWKSEKTKVVVFGRPAHFKTANALKKKITEYFNGWYNTKKVVVRRWKFNVEVEKPMVTITGLAAFLWFASRQSFYDYEAKEDGDFSYAIKRARLFIEVQYEEMLQMWLTNAIFALKNFGWTDKQEVEYTDKTIDATDLEKDDDY